PTTRDELRVVRLFVEVELGEEVLLDIVRQRRELQQLGALGAPLDGTRRRPEELEDELRLLEDAGPPHLHDDLVAVVEQCLVDLAARPVRPRAARAAAASAEPR